MNNCVEDRKSPEQDLVIGQGEEESERFAKTEAKVVKIPGFKEKDTIGKLSDKDSQVGDEMSSNDGFETATPVRVQDDTG